MSDTEPTTDPTASSPSPGTEVVAAAAATSPTTGGGVTFDFVFNGVTYTVQVYAPDAATGEYGFTITQAGNTIASLIYKDDNNWAISAGLPSNLQVDTNLMISKLNIDISKGTVTQPT